MPGQVGQSGCHSYFYCLFIGAGVVLKIEGRAKSEFWHSHWCSQRGRKIGGGSES